MIFLPLTVGVGGKHSWKLFFLNPLWCCIPDLSIQISCFYDFYTAPFSVNLELKYPILRGMQNKKKCFYSNKANAKFL